jgi:triacylglycerol esterase/lipase EstA (alpha/beta hydrolase family)
MTKIFIHGANASPLSWNYIREQVGDGVMLSYSSRNSFKSNLKEMKAQLAEFDDLQFIAHSLGGIYSLHLANHFKHKVKGAVTLSTPYGGHNVPYIARYMFHWNQLLNDILPNNWPINSLNDIVLPCSWCNIVSIIGNVPWILDPNDGVVTIKSQRHRNDMDLIELKCNHYEILLHKDVISIIKERLP